MRSLLATLLLATFSTVLYCVLSYGLPEIKGEEAREEVLTAEETVEKEIESVIRLFNRIYADFYATGGNPSLIDAMPTSKMVKHRIFKDIGYLRDRSLFCVHDLAAFRLLSVTPDEDIRGAVAEVVTEEAWSYRYVNQEDHQPTASLRGIRLSYRYHCRLTPSGWVIQGWDPVLEDAGGGGGS